MSKIKDFFQSGSGAVKVLVFIALFIWVVNLIGGTAYHVWASRVLLESGVIKTGFGIYGVFNIVASCLGLPLVIKGWDLLIGQEKKEK